MRILDSMDMDYSTYAYDIKDGFLDGISVAKKIDKPTAQVFKTLVTQGTSKDYYVFIVPVEKELDLKKGAKVSKEKKIDMIPVKDITKVTGYIKGGCSPIGMKKSYLTFLDASINVFDQIIVSAGKIGFQIELNRNDLIKAIDGVVVDIIKD